mmetsp:Transcript_9897/g.19312  ORF Transcript_9897/g.19312 Transcript_9897/m.19312 type:complete len:284 (-) Transcript_9897:552-1403(-)
MLLPLLLQPLILLLELLLLLFAQQRAVGARRDTHDMLRKLRRLLRWRSLLAGGSLLLTSLPGDEVPDEVGPEVREGQSSHREHEVEASVGPCQEEGYVRGRRFLGAVNLAEHTDKLDKDGKKRVQQNHACGTKQKQGNSQSNSISRLPDRSKHPCHACAHVGSQHKPGRRLDSKHALPSKREKDTHRSARRLNQSRHKRRHKDAQSRVVHSCEQVQKAAVRPHKAESTRHQIHAKEDDSTPKHRHTQLLCPVSRSHRVGDEAKKYHTETETCHLENDEKADQC